MPIARIIPLEAPFENVATETFQKYLPAGMPPLKLFRTLAHNPRVLQRVFAGSLLDQGSISMRERELVILRTCFRCGSEYEWGVHVALFAKAAHLSEADVTATQAQAHAHARLPESEAALLDAVDELHDTSTISEALWLRLTRYFTPPQILELIALVGNYHMVSFMTNAARVAAEDFAPRFAA